MTFLPAESLNFSDGQSAHPDLIEGFAHFVKLEGFDNSLDFFHDTFL